MNESRPPLPPFTEETTRQKVLAAEAAWNTGDPVRVAAASSTTRCARTSGRSPRRGSRAVPVRVARR
jgi:nuclear transport factor 2 (NTF2) superfamily protein